MSIPEVIIRKILPRDNKEIEYIIKATMKEFNCDGPGFSINDPEVNSMYESYSRDRHIFYVVADKEHVYGGAGIAPLAGETEDICELRKMYFLPQLRGVGIGQKLMDICLQEARFLGFKQCYLETMNDMQKAQQLYIKNGFKSISCVMGSTGHFSCDSYFLKNLEE